VKRAGPTIRLILVGLLVLSALVWVWRSSLDATRAGLLVTMIIALVTALYAALTFEILRQNQAMAEAAVQSTSMMERNLRFSYAANLIFSSVVVKNPNLAGRMGCKIADNEDHRRATREFTGTGQQMEFVFAVVRNVGRGPATKILIETSYRVRDSANPNQTYLVQKSARIPLLESDSEVALTIYISRTPTADDLVQLVEAKTSFSDSYRDALSEPLRTSLVNPEESAVEIAQDCILRVK
jgi:hypothetical protein